MTNGSGLDLPAGAEGAILAHRRMIEALFVAIADAAVDREALVAAVERRIGPPDGQEDPGAVPDRSFAVQKAAEEEIARTIRAVRDHIRLARS